MEIRRLQEEEIAKAAGISRYVFDTCIRGRMDFARTVAYIEEYLTEENLRGLHQEGKILLWGAFLGEDLVGVCGLQRDGLLTLLYVLPQHGNRGYGSALLETVKETAKTQLGLERILVNATPAWTSGYFRRQGFRGGSQDIRRPFVTMWAKAGANHVFQRRYVSRLVIAGAAVGTVLFVTVLAILFLLIKYA